MRLVTSIRKTLLENLRDWKVLIMVLVFSPFFVVLMYLFYGGEATVYKLGIVNLDGGSFSVELIDTFIETKGDGEEKLFDVLLIENNDALFAKVKDKSIDAGIVIREDYSEKLSKLPEGVPVETAVVDYYGSMGNTRYAVAAIISANAIYNQGIELSDITPPTGISETFLEKKQPINEFEGYVPGLISLAILMVIFSATASIVKENDKKTIIRLKLSRLGAFNFLFGISLVQVVIAVVAMAFSYVSAIALGYKPVGSFGAMMAVGILSSFSMVAISLIMASYLNTVFDVLTVGVFPFFILMFFSGSMFPLPAMDIFAIGKYSFGITDLLPLKHTSDAFNKILNYGSGLDGVVFEMIMTVILTALYTILGLWLYNKRKLSKA